MPKGSWTILLQLISGKVDTINNHIDQVMEDAPTKLKVTVTLCDADREKIQEMFRKQREWVINQAQTTAQTVNTMLVEERKKTMNRYKEYDGCFSVTMPSGFSGSSCFSLPWDSSCSLP